MADTKFVADAMLGSLARKLRIFGFDTLYFATGADAELERLSRREGRTLLTSDRGLFARCQARGVRSILVEGRTDKERLVSVLREAGSGGAMAGRKSRCAACNGELEALTRSEAAAAKVPPRALARHRLFYRCRACSRVYWRGGHWARLRRLLYSVRRKGLT